MVISTISATPRMLQLLYIREVYCLVTETQLPRLAPEPIEHMRNTGTWAPDRWCAEWQDALAELAANVHERSGIGPSRRDIMNALDPSPTVSYLDGKLATTFADWQRGHLRTLPGSGQGPATESVAVGDLVSAWEKGFTTFVLLPLAGHYAERLGKQILLVSPTTRRSPDAFGNALRSLFP